MKISKQIMCDGCGVVLVKGDSFWSSTNGILMCQDCMEYPQYIMKKAYYSKTLAQAKEVIRDFAEECEESFLD